MPRPPPRIARKVLLSRKKYNDRLRPQHLAFVRSLGICIACGAQGDVEAMHVRAGTDGGTGLKPSDRYTVPGCHACHMRQHQHGELSFWADLGIDPLDAALRLWSKTGDYEAGIRTIQRARQAIALHRQR